jgi:hypothetical protein
LRARAGSFSSRTGFAGLRLPQHIFQHPVDTRAEVLPVGLTNPLDIVKFAFGYTGNYFAYQGSLDPASFFLACLKISGQSIFSWRNISRKSATSLATKRKTAVILFGSLV